MFFFITSIHVCLTLRLALAAHLTIILLVLTRAYNGLVTHLQTVKDNFFSSCPQLTQPTFHENSHVLSYLLGFNI